MELIIRPESVHHWMHGHMGKAKGSGGETVGDAGINLGVITTIGGHELRVGLVPQNTWQVVIPRQNLREQ